jgi:signal transduction histidine kinase
MDNLLNWSRSKLNLLPFHPANFDLCEVIAQHISQFRGMAAQKGMDIITDLQHSGMVYGDREQFNIVIRNLLSNAVKFTPAGGIVSLLTRDQHEGIRMMVSDTGIGIDPAVINDLFDESKAYSTLGLMQEKGAGLGLKLCREFAEKNGGSLEVCSVVQQGTTVVVTIPRITVKPAPQTPGKRRPGNRNSRKKAIVKNG